MKTIIALLLVFAVANASLETIMLRKALGKTTKVVPSDAERTGGWQSVPPTTFTQQNANVLNDANMAITNKYDPEAQGYTFDKVINVQEQIVAGVNYDIVIEYSNGEGSYQIYDVMLYVVPWNPSADQVVRCQLIETVNA